MFLIAKEASLGILGFSLMIWSAKSLIESIVAENFFDLKALFSLNNYCSISIWHF